MSLNNQQCLICHKTKPNQSHRSVFQSMKLYHSLCHSKLPSIILVIFHIISFDFQSILFVYSFILVFISFIFRIFFFFISDFAEEEHSALEIQTEVEKHLKEKEILEENIPTSIVIGPFWVATANVRESLAKKKKALSVALLDLLLKQLRKRCDNVSSFYDIFSNLFIYVEKNEVKIF